MNCYIGYVTSSPPNYPSKSYIQAVNQIQDYLQLQTQNTTIYPNLSLSVIETQSLLTLKFSDSTFTILKNPRTLHTTYYHISITSEEDWDFLKVCYECLLILKQHSPSQIQIQLQCDCQQINERIIQLQKQRNVQFARRLVSQIKIHDEETIQINGLELKDLIYIVNAEYSRKLTHYALKIMNSGRVQKSQWYNLHKKNIEIIQNLGTDPDFKKVCSELMDKITQNRKTNNPKNQPTGFQYQKHLNIDINNNENHSQRINTAQKNYCSPPQMKSLFFQLRQSNNLQRICYLITKAQLSQLNQKQLIKLDKCLLNVATNLINSVYNPSQQYQSYFCQLYGQYLKVRGISISQSMIGALMNRIKNQMVMNCFDGFGEINRGMQGSRVFLEVNDKFEESMLSPEKRYTQET